MNLVIDVAGNLAWLAIRRIDLPSVRMAARKLSEGATRFTFMRSPPG
jgi:hypothetical protein